MPHDRRSPAASSSAASRETTSLPASRSHREQLTQMLRGLTYDQQLALVAPPFPTGTPIVQRRAVRSAQLNARAEGGEPLLARGMDAAHGASCGCDACAGADGTQRPQPNLDAQIANLGRDAERSGDPEDQGGQPLPDGPVELSAAARAALAGGGTAVSACDAWRINLVENPTERPLPPDVFGTAWLEGKITEIGATVEAGKYKAIGTWTQDAGFVVGSSGRTDIGDEDDPAITADNWEAIAEDLSPGADNRPRRDAYWSEYLTTDHELFHVYELEDGASSGYQAMVDTVDAGEYSSEAELVAGVTDGMARYSAAMAEVTELPGFEDRAYEDGAEFYQELADAIREKGEVGEYE